MIMVMMMDDDDDEDDNDDDDGNDDVVVVDDDDDDDDDEKSTPMDTKLTLWVLNITSSTGIPSLKNVSTYKRPYCVKKQLHVNVHTRWNENKWINE